MPGPMWSLSRWRPRLRAGPIGVVLLVLIALPCFVTLPWSVQRYDQTAVSAERDLSRQAPSWSQPMGTDRLGRSLLWRCLLGGAISLGVGISAAMIAVTIGVTWGALAGYVGGRVDSLMMRVVDVFYGLPYILLVVLVDLALSPVVTRGCAAVLGWWSSSASGGAGTSGGWAWQTGGLVADVVTLLLAIGAVSWLTMARVIRGQVLSLREQPFVESARAVGARPGRILRVHMLPNLMGPIVVYTTLTVPQAILQESFLSFLGIGVRAPLPSWGNLASAGLGQLYNLARGGGSEWWLLFFPCLLLGLTLLALNFLGDALRARFDPRSTQSY